MDSILIAGMISCGVRIRLSIIKRGLRLLAPHLTYIGRAPVYFPHKESLLPNPSPKPDNQNGRNRNSRRRTLRQRG